MRHQRSDLTMRPLDDCLKPRSSDIHLRTEGPLASLRSQEMLFTGGIHPIVDNIPTQLSQRSYASLRGPIFPDRQDTQDDDDLMTTFAVHALNDQEDR